MPTLCRACGRRTRTIHGLCPHCGAAKGGGPPVRYERIAQGDFWGDVDRLFSWTLFFGLWLVPGLALIILALFVLASDVLLLLGLLLLLVPIGMRLLGGAEQP